MTQLDIFAVHERKAAEAKAAQAQKVTPPEQAWRDKAPSRQGALRELLADRQWHSADELRGVAGWRYGARLHELRRGEDGGPALAIEKRAEGDGAWFYRQTGEG